MPMPPYTRSHGNIGQSNHGTHNNFGGNGSKGAFASKLNWGQTKDVKVDFKSPLKSYNSDKNSTRKLHQAQKVTTRGTWLRQSSPKTSSTNVVEQVHVSIVVRSAISSPIVLNQNLDNLRVL